MSEKRVAAHRMTAGEREFLGSWRFFTLHGTPTSKVVKVTNIKARGVSGKQGPQIGWLTVEGEIMAFPAFLSAVKDGILRKD